jgi:hypothetical protein
MLAATALGVDHPTLPLFRTESLSRLYAADRKMSVVAVGK